MKILFTSALIDYKYEYRKNEYLKSYNNLLSKFNKNDIFIVECFKKEQHTFLNEINNNVFYTNTNDNNLKNKGVKESLGLIEFVKHNKFNDDEIMLKLTGRYNFINMTFIDDINENKKDYDVFLTKDSYNQGFFGCFAIKFKLLNHFLNNYIDLDHMEKNMINIEKELSDFINENNIKYKLYDKIYIESYINNEDYKIW